MSAAIEVLVNDRAAHAESPLWSTAEDALYWVDTRLTRIYRLEIGSGRRDVWNAPSRLGAIGLRRGGLIVAMKSGISFLDMKTGTFEHVVDIEPEATAARIGDAKMDRAGRFWFVSQDDFGRTPTGTMYRIAADRAVSAHDRAYQIPNGLTWSPDDRRMYAADARFGRIDAYDFDAATGTVANRRMFAEIPADAGTPDGATVDSQGYVWSARNGGGCVVRYAPDGTLDRTVVVPATHVTNVMFGGLDLRTLYITTGWAGLSSEEFWAQPLAGAVLTVRVDVPGIPEPLFGG